MLDSSGQIKLADNTVAGGDSTESTQTAEFLRTQQHATLNQRKQP
jgi:hypothetical protein